MGVEVVDFVKIVRIFKMGIDEIYLKVVGESEDLVVIVRVKEVDRVSWNNLEEKCFMKRLIEMKS